MILLHSSAYNQSAIDLTWLKNLVISSSSVATLKKQYKMKNRAKVIRKTTLVIFLIAPPCYGMQQEVRWRTPRIKTLGESAAYTIIQSLLNKKYADIVSTLEKISPSCQELIKNFLDKHYSLFGPEVCLQQVLSGHSAKITSIALSNDGHFALTGSLDNTARLWDFTKSPVTCQLLTGHTNYVTSVALSRRPLRPNWILG